MAAPHTAKDDGADDVRDSKDPVAVIAAEVTKLRNLNTRCSAIHRLQRLCENASVACTSVEGIRSALRLRTAMFREHALGALLDSVDAQAPTDRESMEAVLHLVTTLTTPMDHLSDILWRIDPQSYNTYCQYEPDAIELALARTDPAMVALALDALRLHASSGRPTVAFSYLLSLMELPTMDSSAAETLHDLLRDPRCAAAMWRCLCAGSSSNLTALILAVPMLKVSLGGQPNGIASGLVTADNDTYDGEDDEDDAADAIQDEGSASADADADGVRNAGAGSSSAPSGRRILLREFLRLGGGNPFGSACAAAAAAARSDAAQHTADAASDDDSELSEEEFGRRFGGKFANQVTLVRLGLLHCVELLCCEGCAAAAQARKPSAWPQVMLHGHVELVVTSLVRDPLLPCMTLGHLEACAADPRVIPALQQAAATNGLAGGLAGVARLLVDAIRRTIANDTVLISQFTRAFKVLQLLCSQSPELQLHFLQAGAMDALLACLKVWLPWQRLPPPAAGDAPPPRFVRCDFNTMRRNASRDPCCGALSWACQLLTALEQARVQQQQAPPAATGASSGAGGMPAGGVGAGALVRKALAALLAWLFWLLTLAVGLQGRGGGDDVRIGSLSSKGSKRGSGSNTGGNSHGGSSTTSSCGGSGSSCGGSSGSGSYQHTDGLEAVQGFVRAGGRALLVSEDMEAAPLELVQLAGRCVQVLDAALAAT